MSNRKRVYMDGVFDLFHSGHIEALKKCKEDNNFVVVGIISDKDCESYKRTPVISERERKIMLDHCSLVNEVIFPAPLVVTREFMNKHKLDVIVHAFSSDKDFQTQKKFYEIPTQMNKMKIISYKKGISTSNIIERIKKGKI